MQRHCVKDIGDRRKEYYDETYPKVLQSCAHEQDLTGVYTKRQGRTKPLSTDLSSGENPGLEVYDGSSALAIPLLPWHKLPELLELLPAG